MPFWIFEVVKSVCAFPTTQHPGGLLADSPGTADNWFGGKSWLFSSGYMIQASWRFLRLFRQAMDCALALALANAGNNKPARIAMMAITTSNSIKVKAR